MVNSTTSPACTSAFNVGGIYVWECVFLFIHMKNPHLCKVTRSKILCRPTAEEMMYFINDQPNAGTVQVKEQKAKMSVY